MKPITYQKIKQKGIISMENGLKILADIEGLDAHKNSVMIRTEKIRKEKENE
ncbi:hypothetical protein FACS189459_3430 [Bacilli bacterium]|nr:hypothetical protein FACS189459_3430 [Bacilli bacterium]